MFLLNKLLKCYIRIIGRSSTSYDKQPLVSKETCYGSNSKPQPKNYLVSE